jgi:hypothetical protein
VATALYTIAPFLVTISGLSITNTNTVKAIVNDGTLTVTNCSVNGGGVSSAGTLAVSGESDASAWRCDRNRMLARFHDRDPRLSVARKQIVPRRRNRMVTCFMICGQFLT